MTPARTAGSAAGALLAGLILLVPSPSQGQDFLFDRPNATISVFGGWSATPETGDVFEEARDYLTLEQGEFAAPTFLGEIGLRLTERIDLGMGVEVASRARPSEMRDWVDMNDQPIPQTTRFTRGQVGLTAKAYLFRRGREVSRLAWVPNRWSPYVGLGAGVGFYELSQIGDFVDEQSLDIFYNEYATSGAGPSVHGLAGLQLSLTPRLLLRGEARYLSAQAGVNGDYDTYVDPIDLSGWRVLVGLSARL